MIDSTAFVPSFEHVFGLSDAIGIFEHADHLTPRREHGYCVDDVARLLVVIAREPKPTRALNDLERIALKFLSAAQAVDGKVRNRRDASGRWSGRHGVEDCWGRSLWALGTAAARSRDRAVRQASLAYFERSTQQRSPHVRAMAFAALGAAEVLNFDPHHGRTRLLLSDAAELIGPPPSDPLWPWPEARLAYANAAVAEALIAAGHLLRRPALTDHGLLLLRWLSKSETFEGHYSPTPVGGSGPGDVAPRFDQQPIEAAAMADACHRAFAVTGDTEWLTRMQLAIGWFVGDNDASTPMFDVESGGGYDGLHSFGANLNQGAESTLALISAQQHARQLTCTAATLG
jgi:hypothetical protein